MARLPGAARPPPAHRRHGLPASRKRGWPPAGKTRLASRRDLG
jgi:hypothetical protein